MKIEVSNQVSVRRKLIKTFVFPHLHIWNVKLFHLYVLYSVDRCLSMNAQNGDERLWTRKLDFSKVSQHHSSCSSETYRLLEDQIVLSGPTSSQFLCHLICHMRILIKNHDGIKYHLPCNY